MDDSGPKVALITGASRGIGRAISLGLAQHGWDIVVNYRRDDEAARQAVQEVERAGGRAIAVQANVAVESDRELLVQTTLDRFRRIDLLVNNAGVAPRRRLDILETSEESYDEVMGINLKGPFFLTQRVAREMINLARGGVVTRGAIVNIGSVSAYASSTNRAEYCLSKAGLGMMTALYADRLASEGIRVYEVRPGIISTDMTKQVAGRYDRMISEGVTPIARWGRPEDVARAVIAIAEDLLPFSTGEVINVDGGFHLRRL
jgi:NAD(P)-dependent dehydrogenase (short-subunit alcohol dehydrogenase family)